MVTGFSAVSPRPGCKTKFPTNLISLSLIMFSQTVWSDLISDARLMFGPGLLPSGQGDESEKHGNMTL